MPSYRVYLLSDLNRIVGRSDFASRDDDAARAVAELVSSACADHAASYELWQEGRRVGAGKPSEPLASGQLEDHVRQAATQAELALQNSRSRIAESRRLLEAV